MDSAPFPHPGQMLESLFMMNVGGAQGKRSVALSPSPGGRCPLRAYIPTCPHGFDTARSPSPVGTGMRTGPCTDFPALLPSAEFFLWHLYATARPHFLCGFPVTETVYIAIHCSTGPLPLCVSPRFVCWSPPVPSASHSGVCLVCTVGFRPPRGDSGRGERQDLLQSSSVW